MARRTSASLRKEMVAALERVGAIRSRAVQLAFRTVPRELFVPAIAARDGLAAIYRPELALLTATDGRGNPISSSSAPAIMAPMLEALRLGPGQRVLEVGTGTGYNAALLKCLVGESGRVTSMDIEPSFARQARGALVHGGFRCRVVVADGRSGWPPGAPYDRLIVTASADHVPRAWRDQLVDGGLVELPLRLTDGLQPQVVATFRRDGDVLRSVAVIPGWFMALRHGPGVDAPIAQGAALRAWSGPSRPTRPTMLVSLEGDALAKLPPAAGRRVLALVLGKSRRLRTIPSASGLGLIMFLNLSGIRRLVRFGSDNRFGVALLGPRATSLAAVTTTPGQRVRIDAWGDEGAEHRLGVYVRRWERLGGPGLQDLKLTVNYEAEQEDHPTQARDDAGSTVAIHWARDTPTS